MWSLVERLHAKMRKGDAEKRKADERNKSNTNKHNQPQADAIRVHSCNSCQNHQVVLMSLSVSVRIL